MEHTEIKLTILFIYSTCMAAHPNSLFWMASQKVHATYYKNNTDISSQEKDNNRSTYGNYHTAQPYSQISKFKGRTKKADDLNF